MKNPLAHAGQNKRSAAHRKGDKKWRVLVLMHETLVPPENLRGYSIKQYDEFKAEFDVVQTLRYCGHDVRTLGMYDNLEELQKQIADWQPHIVYNLLEEFQGLAQYDQHIVSMLELLRQPYTGCNPRGLLLSRDKVLTKQLLQHHGIPTPAFALYPRGKRCTVPSHLRYPLFVKSATEDASVGISQKSVVHNFAELRKRVEYMHETIRTDVLVEEYVRGREVYVGTLGNERIHSLPIRELVFGKLGDVHEPIATRRVKWDRSYQDHHLIVPMQVTDLTAKQEAHILDLAKRICRALSITGYARIDFRMREDGSVTVLEANANPNLSHDEDFSQAALAAGIAFDCLVERIVKLGLSYKAPWK
jgi:D-alanine-D-alanine ligase